MKRLAILALFFLSSNLWAKGTCQAEAEAVIGVLDFTIEGCEIAGKLQENDGKLHGTFRVDLAKLTTGVKLRDEHMRDKYLEVKKYPFAKFILLPTAVGANKFYGDMTIRGMTNRISGEVLSSTKNSLKVKFILDMTNYGIKPPNYKGIGLGQYLGFTASI